MKNLILIISLLLVFLIPGNAQNKSQELYGIVRDAEGKPVQSVTVFIPYTSIAATTNANGEYWLKKIPVGDNEIVFRHLAYTAVSKNIVFNPGMVIMLDVTLSPNIYEIEEIVKRASSSYWKLGYEKFKEYVLGDPYGINCKVNNPTDLYFNFSGDQLNGYAVEPIEVVNNYLGYKLIYFLDYFWYAESKETSIDDRTIRFAFSGEAYYIDLTEVDSPKTRQWKNNRKIAFKGTLKHFMQSAYYYQIYEQGFNLRHTWTDLKEFQDDLGLNPAIANSRWLLTKRLFFRDDEMKKNIDLHYLPENDRIVQVEVNEYNLSDSTKVFTFENSMLVFYFLDEHQSDDEARISYFRIIADNKEISPHIVVDHLGNYKVIGGTLQWDYLDKNTKLGTALPMDYNEPWNEDQ